MKNGSINIKTFLAIFLLGIHLLQHNAIAQQAPRSLLPNLPPEDNKTLTPNKHPEHTESTDTEISKQENLAKNGIQIDELKELDVDSVGILDPSFGGLDKDMWGNSPRPLVITLLKQLPDQLSSKTLRDLKKRLLLSRVTSPGPNSNLKNESLIHIRQRALFNAGDLDNFRKLEEMIPTSYQNEELAKLSINVSFIVNDLDRACSQTKLWFERSQDKFWQKALIFCDALNSSWDKVDFGIQLLSELNEDSDSKFLSLIQSIAGDMDTQPTLSIESIVPRDVAMLRSAQLELPEHELGSLPPWLFKTYLESPGVTQQARIQIAEKAFNMGIIKRPMIARLYETISIQREDIDRAVSLTLSKNSSIPQVLLYRLALSQESIFGKAQAIQQTLSIAIRDNFISEMAELYKPLLKSIPVSSELSWFASDAALLHTINHDLEDAELWIKLAKSEAKLDGQSKLKWVKVWPLIRLLRGDRLLAWDSSMLKEWKQIIFEQKPRQARDLVNLIYHFMQMVGEPIDNDTWRELAGAGTQTPPRYSIFVSKKAIESAINKNLIGEAIAILLVSFGSQPIEKMGSEDFVLAVSSINALGLNQEARQLAFEILATKLYDFWE